MQALGVGSNLSGDDLQTIIDREEVELVRLFGAVYVAATPIAETTHGGGRSIYLKRQIGTVSSIVEYRYPGDTAPITLVAADYYVWQQEGRIERVPYGTTASSRWGAVVTVSYIPVDDRSLWRMVLIDLVRVGINRRESGTWSETKKAGEISHTVSGSVGTAGWEAQRAAILSRLGYLST